MRLVKQSVLFFREGNSDKTYEIDLCDTGDDKYVVNFRYGRRGTALKEGSKTPVPVSLAEAQKIFDAIESEKIGKGYTTDLSGISSIPVAAPLVLESSIPLTGLWMNMPAGRNKAILQRLHNAATGQKGNNRWQWKLSRIIWKAGEYKIEEATPYIIKLFNNADALQQYACCWALARTGGNQAAEALKTIYTSHSSSRIAKLAGAGLLNVLEGLEKEQHVLHYINSLPEDFKSAIYHENIRELQNLASERITQLQQTHTWLESLYLVSADKKWVRPVVKQLLLSIALQPGYFKHIRTIYKWSELLNDFEISGALSCRFEREPEMFTHYLSTVDRQSVKTHIAPVEDHIKLSAEFAKTNSRIAYSNKTRWYLHHRTLRRLEMLGKTGNTDYVKLSTAILISYNRQTDEKEFYSEFGYTYINNRYERAETRFPASAQAIYMHQVLSGNNNKLKLVSGHRWQILNEPVASHKKQNEPSQSGSGLLKIFTGLFGKKKTQPVAQPEQPQEPVVTNETGTPYLHLWNALPQAYVQLLMDAQMDEIHEFALNYLKKHPDYTTIIDRLDTKACIKLLGSPYKVPAEFGFTVTEKKFTEAHRDIPLVLSMFNSICEPARQKAKQWADSDASYFFEDSDFITGLIFAKHDDIRTWGSNNLKNRYFPDNVQKLVTGKAIALLQSFTPKDCPAPQVIKEGTDTLFEICSGELEMLNARVLADVLQHPVPEVLLFGLRILNRQKERLQLQDLPDSFIASLLQHSYEPVRAQGLQLLLGMPADTLTKRADLVLNSCITAYTDVRKGIAPVAAKLAAADHAWGAKAASELMPALLRKIT